MAEVDYPPPQAEAGQHIGHHAPAHRKERDRVTVPNAVAMGAGAAMLWNGKDVLHGAEESEKPGDGRIRIEPGIHISDENGVTNQFSKSMDQVIADFNNGDLGANFWENNDKLTERLASFRPQVIAVDSLAPTPKGDDLDKLGMWMGLPGRPREINQTGFYVVSGDTNYQAVAEELRLSEERAGINPQDQHSEYWDEVAKEAGDAQQALKKKAIVRDAVGIGMLVGAGISSIGAWGFRKPAEDEEGVPIPETEKQQFTRRGILKIGAGAAALFATRGFWDLGTTQELSDGATKAAEAPREAEKDFWEEINNYTTNIPQSILDDGRTALLIAKQEDAMDYLEDEKHPYLKTDAKGAVVLGSGHDYKSELFMHDKKARAAAMYIYAKHVIQIADKISFEQFKFTKEQRTQLTQQIIQYIGSVEISRVKDPGKPSGESASNYVNDNITHVDTIQSKQVGEAINRLTYEQALKMTDS